MEKVRKFSILFILFVILSGSIHSPARADGSGQHRINIIKSNPCGKLTLKTGGTYTFPVATCEGYKGGSASINVPIREWDINPEYPFVNTPFFMGIGTYLGSLGIHFEPKTTAEWPGKVKITNYKTEVRLVPYKITGNFNGAISGDSSMGFFGRLYEELKSDNPRFEPLYVSSISDLDSTYYKEKTKSEAYIPGTDTAVLVLESSKSSYHAANPSEYKGEPAYRLTVTSHYMVEARASWSSYQFWIRKEVGEQTVCAPGPNSLGRYECFLNPGDFQWRGHYTTQTLYDWLWGDEQEKNGDTDWVPIRTVSTNLVRWPDGRNHDHIPLLVYQSQPLLQKP